MADEKEIDLREAPQAPGARSRRPSRAEEVKIKWFDGLYERFKLPIEIFCAVCSLVGSVGASFLIYYSTLDFFSKQLFFAHLLTGLWIPALALTITLLICFVDIRGYYLNVWCKVDPWENPSHDPDIPKPQPLPNPSNSLWDGLRFLAIGFVLTCTSLLSGLGDGIKIFTATTRIPSKHDHAIVLPSDESFFNAGIVFGVCALFSGAIKAATFTIDFISYLTGYNCDRFKLSPNVKGILGFVLKIATTILQSGLSAVCMVIAGANPISAIILGGLSFIATVGMKSMDYMMGVVKLDEDRKFTEEVRKQNKQEAILKVNAHFGQVKHGVFLALYLVGSAIKSAGDAFITFKSFIFFCPFLSAPINALFVATSATSSVRYTMQNFEQFLQWWVKDKPLPDDAERAARAVSPVPKRQTSDQDDHIILITSAFSSLKAVPGQGTPLPASSATPSSPTTSPLPGAFAGSRMMKS